MKSNDLKTLFKNHEEKLREIIKRSSHYGFSDYHTGNDIKYFHQLLNDLEDELRHKIISDPVDKEKILELLPIIDYYVRHVSLKKKFKDFSGIAKKYLNKIDKTIKNQ